MRLYEIFKPLPGGSQYVCVCVYHPFLVTTPLFLHLLGVYQHFLIFLSLSHH